MKGTRTVRLRTWTVRPEGPETEPVRLHLHAQCVVCDASGPAAADSGTAMAWAAQHRTDAPTHLTYQLLARVPVHGEQRTYSAGCRCPECRRANTAAVQVGRARRAATPAAADRAGHGKPSTYTNYRCRCTDCRAAENEDRKRRRQRRRRAAGPGGPEAGR